MPSSVDTAPCDARVYPGERLVYVRLPDVVADHNLTACMTHVTQHAAWDDAFDLVWDFRGVRSLEPEPADLARFVHERSTDGPGLDVCLVTREVDELFARWLVAASRRRDKAATIVHTVEGAAAVLGRGAVPFD